MTQSGGNTHKHSPERVEARRKNNDTSSLAGFFFARLNLKLVLALDLSVKKADENNWVFFLYLSNRTPNSLQT